MKLLAWLTGIPWGLVAFLVACAVAAGLAIYFRQWRLLIWIGLAAVVGVTWQRVVTWHESHQKLPIVQAELEQERTCAPASACARRAEEAAEQARAEAETRALEAAEALRRAEEKARADAAAWRAKYREATQTDPECKAWSEQRISCPL